MTEILSIRTAGMELKVSKKEFVEKFFNGSKSNSVYDAVINIDKVIIEHILGYCDVDKLLFENDPGKKNLKYEGKKNVGFQKIVGTCNKFWNFANESPLNMDSIHGLKNKLGLSLEETVCYILTFDNYDKAFVNVREMDKESVKFLAHNYLIEMDEKTAKSLTHLS